MPNASAIPPGFAPVTACLVVHGCDDAIAFYRRAFGAEEVARVLGSDGKSVVQAELRLGTVALLVAEATALCPPTSSLLVLYVDDCDAAQRTALAAGAKSLMPPMDKFYGARSGQVVDPFGQRWTLSTQLEHISALELAERARDVQRDCATD